MDLSLGFGTGPCPDKCGSNGRGQEAESAEEEEEKGCQIGSIRGWCKIGRVASKDGSAVGREVKEVGQFG
jgi:hypothetical protein